MAQDLIMPMLGLTMVSGTVTHWHKNVGDPVHIGDVVLEIETDKYTHEITAETDGVLLEIRVNAGEEVPVKEVLGVIGDASEAVVKQDVIETTDKQETPDAEAEEMPSFLGGGSASVDTLKLAVTKIATKTNTATPEARKGGRIAISPAARKLACANQLDYSNVIGTGPGGRIVYKDIEKALATMPKEAPAAVAPATVSAPAVMPVGNTEEIPYKGMRRAIGSNMQQVWTSTPMVTHWGRVDVTALLALRESMNAGAEKADRISVNDLLVKLVAESLAEFPAMNAVFAGDKILRCSDVNVGVAVSLGQAGLMVPVVKNAAGMGMKKIHQSVTSLVEKARNGALSPDECAGGSFTISNLGTHDSVEMFTPILQDSQTGILGVGKIVEQPVVINGEIGVAKMMGLALTYDHRIVDGSVAADFMDVLFDKVRRPLQAIM